MLTNVTVADVGGTGIYINGGTGSHTLTDVTVADIVGTGIYVRSIGPTVTATNLTIQNVGATALAIIAADAGKWRSSNTSVSGTGILAIRFDGGTITDTRSWDENLIYYLSGEVTIAEGAELTIPAGKIVKADGDDRLRVDGTLKALGTAGSHIVFTSIKDDTIGGDTNANGAATAPAAGDWQSVWISSDVAVGDLDYVDIRYAGEGSASIDSSIRTIKGHLSFANSTVSDGLGDGVWLYGGTATLSGNTISNVQEYGIRVDTNSAVTLTNNAITNAGYGPLRLRAGSPATTSGTTSIGSGRANAIHIQGGTISDARQ
ncbi:MAG: right-handed parallel beta-helix repeat-containing protein [Planctomycetota bacterium]